MRVLVTGGAGFIGANLCRELVDRDEVDSVAVLDDFSTGDPENLKNVPVEVVEGSLLDRDLIVDLVDSVDSVVHLAARPSVPKSLVDPLATHEVNTTGTLYLLEAARRRDVHTVVASSSSVYGTSPELPKNERMAARPLSPYGVSKLATEAYALAYNSSFGLPTLAFRFFNVYGPLQPAGHAYAAVVPSFVSAALAGRPLTVYGDGTQTRDFTFVGSVTSVLSDAIVRRVVSAEPVNLAFGSRLTLLDLIARLEQVLGRSLTVDHQPPRRGDIHDSQASDELLRRLFPESRRVAIEEGLAQTVSWFRSQAR